MTNATSTPVAAADAGPATSPAASPASPRTVIRPPGGWPVPDFSEIWRYRDLLVLLTSRNVAARYRQSVLGLGWALVRPVTSVGIFTVIFGKAVGLEDDLPAGISYALFSFCGLLPWMFFAAALAGTTESVVGAQDMLTKVYFPRIVLPLSNLGVAAVDLAIQLVLLVIALAVYRILPGLEILALPAFLLLAATAALACGLWLTALNVKYRDVKYAVPFMLQAGMYLCPIIYPVTKIPEQWRAVYFLNPMAGAIEGVRWSVLGAEPPDWGYVGLSAAATALLLAGGTMYFTRTERTFADII
ncbi:ABC transporter permease [Alienimonas chondri]|uniref:Transport permease protein n=1 Tax=Alienimonas chondri TaxID=2681879 RepID=A0ABX1VAQ7_9PLAN|nr:ABC transporter permease [Alienimonas chondri]NNJ25139.1 Teichoic acid translocation permease protein TagG [Alienimonas chondri]